MPPKCLFVYIVTNKTKTVLYTGVTNDLAERITNHYFNKGTLETFAGRYNCFNLVHYEIISGPKRAIEREKQIKSWISKKKVALIESENPEWKFLNSEIMDWPPEKQD